MSQLKVFIRPFISLIAFFSLPAGEMNIEVGFIGENLSHLDTSDAPLNTDHVIVTPGEVISVEAGYLRGHGTYQGLIGDCASWHFLRIESNIK